MLSLITRDVVIGTPKLRRDHAMLIDLNSLDEHETDTATGLRRSTSSSISPI